MPTPHLHTALHPGPVTAAALPDTPGCGAECVFLGRTRAETHPEHGELIRLDYEAYAPMAEKLLREVAAEIAAEFGLAAVRLVHATGPVAVGEASVVVQVAAPHRGAGFDACRAGIDRLKERVPVWKHEVWERGVTFAPGHAPGPRPPATPPPTSRPSSPLTPDA